MHHSPLRGNGGCASPVPEGVKLGNSAELPIPPRRWSLTLALALLGATATCTTGAADDAPAGAILFIGNSLTYANDLPAMVRRVAEAAGGELRVGMAAGPDLALIDHTTGATDAVTRISSGRWDVVVLQQGPTPAGICRDTLVMAAMRLAPAIRRAGGRPALFLPWTRQAYTGPLDEIAESATLAARAVGGLVLPVGVAWRKALEADPSLPLYARDGYHPAPAGTLLTALTIYDRVVGGDASAIAPKALEPLPAGLTPARLRVLLTAAHAASREWPADPEMPAPPDTTRPEPLATPAPARPTAAPWAAESNPGAAESGC